MKKHKYSIWFALTYEILNDLSQHFKTLKQNKLVQLVLKYCKHDWVLWKIESTLSEVDEQIEQIKKQWETNESPRYSVIEHAPDGSKAQELLGGAIEIRSNFKRD